MKTSKTLLKAVASVATAGFLAVSLTACGQSADDKACDAAKQTLQDNGVKKESDIETAMTDPTRAKAIGDGLTKAADDNPKADIADGLDKLGGIMTRFADLVDRSKDASSMTAEEAQKLQADSQKLQQDAQSKEYKDAMESLDGKCKAVQKG